MPANFKIPLKNYLDKLSTFHCLIDLDGKIIFSNRSSLDLVNRSITDAVGKNISDIFFLADNFAARKKFEKAILKTAKGKPCFYKEKIYAFEGIKHLAIHLEPYIDEKQSVECIIVEAFEISDLIKNQKQMELEHKVFSIITKTSVNSRGLKDLCKKLLSKLGKELNFECGTLRLYDPETKMLTKASSVGISRYRKMSKNISIDDPCSAGANTARTLKPVFAPDAKKHEIYKTHKKRFDEHNCRSFVSWPIMEKDNDLIGVLQLFSQQPKDISEYTLQFFKTIADILASVLKRKFAEEKLRKSELKYSALIEGMADGIIVINKNKNITYANKFFEKLSGYKAKELKLMKWTELTEQKHHKQLQKIHLDLLNGKLEHSIVETSLIAKNNSTIHVEINLKASQKHKNRTEYIVLIRDITERIKSEKEKKILEERMIQAQKMEAIGTLASGIAHDFNNILFPIMGYAEITHSMLPENRRAKNNLEEILKAANRAKQLVQQILAFSRQGKESKTKIELSPIIKEALKFIKATFPSTVNVTCNISNDLGTVNADPVQIHQIIINLCTNALHAMEENGGTLSVNLDKIEFGCDTIAPVPDIKPGIYNQLSVNDTGFGMENNVIEKIFDPYFTTKPQGKGTGLGLSIVHGIVKSSKGYINVRSKPGKGTSFNVYLPVVENGFKNKSQKRNIKKLSSGSGHILLVDDEIQVVNVMKKMLEGLGYKISFRTGSIDALEAFKANHKQYDLVITDYTMPNMTGTKLAKELFKMRSDIPVILCTGFSEKLAKKRSELHGLKNILIKPVALKELSATVNKTIRQAKTN